MATKAERLTDIIQGMNNPFENGAVLYDGKGDPVCVIQSVRFSSDGTRVSIEAVTYGELAVPIGSAAALIASAPTELLGKACLTDTD